VALHEDNSWPWAGNENKKGEKVMDPEKVDVKDELELKGAFIESLKRNNKQIRDDRAVAIAEAVQLKYRRAVEDLEVLLKDAKRRRENMLDLSPDTALSLKPAKDVDADKFVEEDLRIGFDIRDLEIKLEIAKRQYTQLFGTM
jgi:hypothetical protein